METGEREGGGREGGREGEREGEKEGEGKGGREGERERVYPRTSISKSRGISTASVSSKFST